MAPSLRIELPRLPGGIGVFETVILLLLSPTLPASSVVRALIAFRGIYYLLPLVVATALLAAYELVHRRERGRRVVASLR